MIEQVCDRIVQLIAVVNRRKRALRAGRRVLGGGDYRLLGGQILDLEVLETVSDGRQFDRVALVLIHLLSLRFLLQLVDSLHRDPKKSNDDNYHY